MSKKQRKGDPRPWVPLHQAQSIPHTPEQQAKIRAYIIDKGVPEDRADAEMAEMMTWPNEVWKNHHYTVHVDRRDDGSVQELSIRRDDRKPARDWRDFQRIKNEIAGENASFGRGLAQRARRQIWILKRNRVSLLCRSS
jgi:hypothetical protein